MKNYYSDLSLKLNFEIINKVKLRREASQENFAFLTTKISANGESRTLDLSKSVCVCGGGGGTNPLLSPHF